MTDGSIVKATVFAAAVPAFVVPMSTRSALDGDVCVEASGLLPSQAKTPRKSGVGIWNFGWVAAALLVEKFPALISSFK